METEGSLPHIQMLATCLFPKHLNLLPPKCNNNKQCSEKLHFCNRSFYFQNWILTATTPHTLQFDINILLVTGVWKYQYWVISCGQLLGVWLFNRITTNQTLEFQFCVYINIYIYKIYLVFYSNAFNA